MTNNVPDVSQEVPPAKIRTANTLATAKKQ